MDRGVSLQIEGVLLSFAYVILGKNTFQDVDPEIAKSEIVGSGPIVKL